MQPVIRVTEAGIQALTSGRSPSKGLPLRILVVAATSPNVTASKLMDTIRQSENEYKFIPATKFAQALGDLFADGLVSYGT